MSWEARFVLRKYHPKIVGVTGSVGKTSTKDAIALVLSAKYDVRKSDKSYNSDIGVPLTILGEKSAWNNPLEWLKIIFRGLDLIFTKNKYPEWLVLEMGAGRPNEIRDNVRWIKFDMAVLTSLPDVPVHVEIFGSRERLVKEKMFLVNAIGSDGFVVLCSDDLSVMAMNKDLPGQVITYGLTSNSLVKATDYQISYSGEGELKVPAGLSFVINYQENNWPVFLDKIVGPHMLYPVLAAFACGVSVGVNPVDIVKKLSTFKTPPGRQHLISGINNSIIIDDTYNSSPVALEAALKALVQIETSGRKIAVVGDMMELGSHTAIEHKRMGELASGICDFIITVGVRARFAYESALSAGFAPDKIFHFDTSVLAGEYLKTVVGAGDIILVKGSQSARMEKTVEKIMLQPELKSQLLVRQEEEWLSKK